MCIVEETFAEVENAFRGLDPQCRSFVHRSAHVQLSGEFASDGVGDRPLRHAPRAATTRPSVKTQVSAVRKFLVALCTRQPGVRSIGPVDRVAMVAAMRQVLCSVAILFLAFCCVEGSSSSVKSLPGIGPLKPRTHSGYLLANKEYGAYLFYVFMESLSDPANDPVILWLQGGPGSSSMFGCFVENGPYRMLANGTFVWNDQAWNTNASVIWIDQPVGTGFSYAVNASGYVRHERALAEDLATAMAAFFTLHAKFANNRFYVFGESYGGKYAPWLADVILADPSYGLHVDGVALGNGWVSPAYQTPTNPQYLCAHPQHPLTVLAPLTPAPQTTAPASRASSTALRTSPSPPSRS